MSRQNVHGWQKSFMQQHTVVHNGISCPAGIDIHLWLLFGLEHDVE